MHKFELKNIFYILQSVNSPQKATLVHHFCISLYNFVSLLINETIGQQSYWYPSAMPEGFNWGVEHDMLFYLAYGLYYSNRCWNASFVYFA